MVEPVIEKGLREIVATRATLASLETALVRRARLEGASWNDLAKLLEMTRQGVRARHLAVDPINARARASQEPTVKEYYAKIDAWLIARARSDRERPLDT